MQTTLPHSNLKRCCLIIFQYQSQVLTGFSRQIEVYNFFFLISTNSSIKIVTAYTLKIGIPGLGNWHVDTTWQYTWSYCLKKQDNLRRAIISLGQFSLYRWPITNFEGEGLLQLPKSWMLITLCIWLRYKLC